MSADPFGLDDEAKPPRDRWGRPLVIPAVGGERVPYTRASSFGGYLTDDSSLSAWRLTLTARGLARRDDLVAMIAALPACHDERAGKKMLTAAQKREDKATKAKLKEYVEAAQEAAGRHWKANLGTAMHGLTEPGMEDAPVPSLLAPDVESFRAFAARSDVELLATEVFVVNDDLQAAGTFDHLARLPYLCPQCRASVFVIDKKGGEVDGKALGFSVQLTVYAGGLVYDLDTEQRAPLESLTGGEAVCRCFGFIAHVPLGAGRTDLYRVDLSFGRRAARLAAMVRTARKEASDGVMTPAALGSMFEAVAS